MGVFFIKNNQQAVQGFPVNRSYTKDEANALFGTGTFQGVLASEPSGPVEGWTYINSGDNGYYIYYGGTWQLLHTLTPSTLSYFLLEDDFNLLLEDGFKLALQ